MIGVEAAVVAEADKLRANRKTVKELQIGEKSEAELATLNTKSSSSPSRPLSSPLSNTPPGYYMFQPRPEIPRLCTPI